MTFFVMNLACFLLKIGSAPNFRPAFHFFSWQTAFLGSALSAAAMFFIDETYAVSAITLLVLLFLLIHYASPPKHWGDVSQNLIYHQVRKYLLRLKPEHIKFWRPQIILLINDPRHHTRLIQFCNSMKKGSLYMVCIYPCSLPKYLALMVYYLATGANLAAVRCYFSFHNGCFHPIRPPKAVYV